MVAYDIFFNEIIGNDLTNDEPARFKKNKEIEE